MSTGPETIDALLRRRAQDDGDRIALIDAPNRAGVIGGAPRTLTYAEADRVVGAIAWRLRSLGLRRGSIIAVQLPHTVESILTCLGILRAGMAVALLPQLWRRRDIVAALAPIGARAIITMTRIGDLATAEIAMTAAVDLFTVRYVCAFGDDPPDGVVPCDDVFDLGEESDNTAAPTPDGDLESRTETAVITFDTAWGDAASGDTAGSPVAVPRAHDALLAGGQAICATANLSASASILSPLPVSSFAGLSLTMLPWLLTGGTLSLHLPFDAELFSRQLCNRAIDCVVLPGPALPALADVLAVAPSATLLGLWRAPERHPASAHWPDRPKLIDILSFGETGFVPAPLRPSGEPGAIAVSLSSTPVEQPVSVTLTEAGTIALSGAMVAGAAAPPGQSAPEKTSPEETNSVVDTGFRGRIDAESDTLIVTGGRPGAIAVGGYAFGRADLEDLGRRTHLGATWTSAPDDLLGQRPAGQSLHPALAREWLDEQGVNPLLVESFHDQMPAEPSAEPDTSLDAEPTVLPTALTGR